MGYAMFSAGDLRIWLQERLAAAIAAVGEVDSARLLFSPEEVVDSLVEGFSVEPLRVDWDNLTRGDVHETAIGANPAQAVTLSVPVVGAVRLLQLRASQFTMSTPSAKYLDGAITFTVTGAELSPESIATRIDAMYEDLEKHVTWANTDVEEWSPHLRAEVARTVSERRARVQQIAETNAALNIPLKASAAEQQVQVPVRRKSVKIVKEFGSETARRQPHDSEPQISRDVYEEVLRTIRAMGNSFERLPKTARRFNEEEVRDLILFVLNSNFEGLARGEVFNGDGKTDILVPYEGQNAFIGECKFWKGQAKFTEAIDQLLGYTVWRDTKAALLIFIRSGEPTQIMAKADECIRAHACFLSAKPAADAALRSDYLMHAKDDPARHIQMALLPVVLRSAGED